MTERTFAAPVQHLGLAWFAMVMGLCGLSLAAAGPERMLPVTFITIAPPSVLALSGHQLGAPEVLLHMLWGVAAFFTALSVHLTPARVGTELGQHLAAGRDVHDRGFGGGHAAWPAAAAAVGARGRCGGRIAVSSTRQGVSG